MDQLNHRADVPFYIQLSNILRDAIQSGEYPPGTQIPTEAELSEKHHVSRITVRNAINLLVDEKLLIRQQGKGTFVSAPVLESKTNHLQGFTEMGIEQGIPLVTRNLSITLTAASRDDALTLNLPPDSKVIVITRLLYIREQPFMFERITFSQEHRYLFDEVADGSIYEVLRRHNIRPHSNRKCLDVCFATPEEAGYLQVEPGRALLLCDDLVMDANGVPLHRSKQIIRSDICRLTITSSSYRIEQRDQTPERAEEKL